jgi:hypothetical protein
MTDGKAETNTVFLSYARDEDEPFVARLHKDLGAAVVHYNLKVERHSFVTLKAIASMAEKAIVAGPLENKGRG